MRTSPSERDGLFREAVAAIDAGDIASLERLVAAHPALVCERLESPGDWLREKVGKALDGPKFFARPYLLWFVAEDPVRNGRLPQNIAAVAQKIIDLAKWEAASNLQEQLDHALTLVSWSWIARDCGVQLALIDVLVDAGAALDGNQNNALVNGNVAAAEHLVKRGANLTLEVALALGRWDAVDRLLVGVAQKQKQMALVLSALRGWPEAVRRMLSAGADPKTPSTGLYSHGTPLHHAVWSGSLDTVKALVEAGADPAAKDTAWDATPLGWAEHALSSGDQPGKQYAEIAAYLKAASSA
jgi:peptide-methionine (S)-S-oxide reductase